MLDSGGVQKRTFSEHMTGLDFYLDPGAVDATSAARIRGLLEDAIASLDQRQAPAEKSPP